MSNLNKDKVRWGIVWGAPKLKHPQWYKRTPDAHELKEIWDGCGLYESGNPVLFKTKKEAEEYLQRRDIGTYNLRVQKYNPHQPLNKEG